MATKRGMYIAGLGLGEYSSGSSDDLGNRSVNWKRLRQRRGAHSDGSYGTDNYRRSASAVDGENDCAYESAGSYDSEDDEDSNSVVDSIRVSNSEAVSNRVAVRNHGSHHNSVHEDDEDHRAANGPLVEVLENPIIVPRMEKTSFTAWSSFRQYLKSYSARTYQILSVKSGNSVTARNAIIRESLTKKYGHKPALLEQFMKEKLIPEHFGHYTKFVGCTHGGKPRIRSGDSENSRVHQTHRAINCPAKMNLCVQWRDEDDAWRVYVTRQVAYHNHEVSEKMYKAYPENRRIKDKAVLDVAEVMLEHGTPRKGILAYLIQKSGKDLEMKDVHNFLAKMKADKYAQNPTVEGRVKQFLKDFSSEPGNASGLFTNEVNQAIAVTIQTEHMRAMFHQFPEVVLIDATHDTNNAQYKLFSFMVHDALGHGQHVQHSLIANEQAATLRTVCQQFKRCNLKWREIRCIILDKDFTEMAVIEKEFPLARVLLCKFHVVRYLQSEVCKGAYGLTDWQKKNMKVVLAELVEASSEAVYDRKLRFIHTLLGTDEKRATWLEYFDKNWSSCKQKWCAYLRCDVPHLGNVTNNRLESSWQKLKPLLNKTKSLDECLISLLFWQKTKETMWWRVVKKVGRAHVSNADYELNKLAGLVSCYTFKLVRKQYDFAMKPSTSYHQFSIGKPLVLISYASPPVTSDDENDDDGCAVQTNDDESDDDFAVPEDDVPDEHSVNTKTWECSCEFMMTHLLPCRHVLYLRRFKFPKAVIPLSKLNSRWLLKTVASRTSHDTCRAKAIDVTPFVVQAAVRPATSRSLTSSERYNRILNLCKLIADSASRHGTAHVLKIEGVLTKLLERVKRGEIPDIPSAPTVLAIRNSSENELQTATEVLPVPESLSADELLSANSLLPSATEPELTGSQIDHILDVLTSMPSLETRNCDDESHRASPPANPNEEQPEQADKSTEQAFDQEQPTEPSWHFVHSASVRGKPSSAKKQRVREKKRQDRAGISSLYNFFTESGKLGTLATFTEFKHNNKLTFSKASGLLDSIKTVDTYAHGRVYPAQKKKPTALEELTMTLSDSVLNRVETAVRRYRNKQPERQCDVVVTIENTAYSSATLRLMREVNRVKECRQLVVAGLKWIATDPCQWVTPLQWFQFPIDYKRTASVIKNLDLSSQATNLLNFCAKQHINSDCIEAALKAIQQQARRRVLYVLPAITAIDGTFEELLLATPAIQELRSIDTLPATESLPATQKPLLLLALHFRDPEHWCGLVVDFATNICTAFDPFQDSARYSRITQWIEQHLLPVIPRFKQVRFQRQRFQSIIQRDNYNCGVIVLMFFELMLARVPGASISENELSDALKFVRYRYLWLTLEAPLRADLSTTEARSES